MNVYKVNEYYIAAKNPEDAFYEFMEYTDAMESTTIYDLDEDEEEVIKITIKRLSNKTINVKDVPCHGDNEDDCKICADNNDYIYSSMQEIIDQTDKKDFPKVLCWDI